MVARRSLVMITRGEKGSAGEADEEREDVSRPPRVKDKFYGVHETESREEAARRVD